MWPGRPPPHMPHSQVPMNQADGKTSLCQITIQIQFAIFGLFSASRAQVSKVCMCVCACVCMCVYVCVCMTANCSLERSTLLPVRPTQLGADLHNSALTSAYPTLAHQGKARLPHSSE